MDKLITALGPVFAAGFAVQQLLEIITSFLDLDSSASFQKYKKPILGLVSLLIGFALSFGVPELRVLQPLFANVATNPATGQTALANTVQIPHVFDAIVTGLVLSGGTEGINSILKFLKYSKENKAAQAADTVADVAAKMAAPAQ